jgi:hypothetical protein
MDEFITPPIHINFLAKKLFQNVGEIIDGSITYLEIFRNQYGSISMELL